jgi:DnaK suppressor protein
MTKEQANQFREVLTARVVELEHSTRRRDAILIERSADDLDRRLHAAEREFAVRNLETTSARLRDARTALQLIDQGRYGTCQECDEPINPRRLAAMPSAVLCIRCQEAVDCRCGAASGRAALAMAA